jgi:hypothetical protein
MSRYGTPSRAGKSMRAIGFVLTVFAAGLIPGQVSAHGGGPGLEYDSCAQWTGPERYVHFSAYQPGFNRFAEYCRSVPRGGATLMVFDLVGTDPANTPVALEIVKQGGPYHLSLPPKRYPSGVIDVHADLESGDYNLLLTVGGGRAASHLHFELAVSAWWYPLVAPAVLIAIILSAAAAYCLFQARKLAGEAFHGEPKSSPARTVQA